MNLSDLEDDEFVTINLFAKYNVPYTKPNKAYNDLVDAWIPFSAGRNKKAAPCWWWYNVFTAMRRGYGGLRVQMQADYWTDNPCGVSYRGVRSVVEYAEREGLVTRYTGCYTRELKAETVLVFTDKLKSIVELRIIKCRFNKEPLENPIVIKKRGTEDRLDVCENEETIRMKDEVLKYNESLCSARIEWGGTPVPFVEYKRSFSDDLYHGGRLYADGGGVQTIPSVYRRKHLTIDGEPVVEVDYSAQHPRILYEYEWQSKQGDLDGFKVDFDPYGASQVVAVDLEAIENHKARYGLSEYNPVRNLYKLALVVMLSAKDEGKARQAINHSIYLDRMKDNEKRKMYVGLSKFVNVGDVMEALANHNSPINHYFYRDFGLRLQNIDATIALKVIDYLVQCGEVCLAYHDSFIVKEKNRELLEHCMRHAWLDVVGSDEFCKITAK